jgi:hypothetical protein
VGKFNYLTSRWLKSFTSNLRPKDFCAKKNIPYHILKYWCDSYNWSGGSSGLLYRGNFPKNLSSYMDHTYIVKNLTPCTSDSSILALEVIDDALAQIDDIYGSLALCVKDLELQYVS